jgi:hypothetical protein
MYVAHTLTLSGVLLHQSSVLGALTDVLAYSFAGGFGKCCNISFMHV